MLEPVLFRDRSRPAQIVLGGVVPAAIGALAGVLVGHTVSYTDDNGVTKTGTVRSVLLGDGTKEATATVDGASVPMGRITAVTQPAA